jgi:hypothetical protein
VRGRIIYNRGEKFDLQLGQALIDERRLGKIFEAGRIEKIELKTERWLWERTGNIAIEFRHDGRPSGIAVTEADYWVHELCRGEETLLYMMFPIERLKDLARDAYHRPGRRVLGCGDDRRSDIVKVALGEVLRNLRVVR